MILFSRLSFLADTTKHIIISCLSYIVPKKKGYWVFVSFQFYGKYSANNKALFEYFQENKSLLPNKQEIVYVTNTKETQKIIQNYGYPVIYNRFFWLLPLLRAETIFTDGARSFMGFGRFKFVQLWHGTGYKNIALSYSGKKHTWIRHYFLKKFFDQMILVSATSEEDKQRKSEAFNNKNVKITGSPRNDIFFNVVKPANEKQIILYAPTFRDTGGEFSPMSKEAWKNLDELMERNNSLFLVKKHPSDYKLSIPTDTKNIKDVTGETEDIQALLVTVDVLVTDYSGITSDFVITGRPIIFYTYDFDEYVKLNRTFYYDIKNVLPGPFASNSTELLYYLNDLEWFNDLNYQKKYQDFRRRFHKFNDGNSCKRITNEILKLHL